jgi:hypothetical protein
MHEHRPRAVVEAPLRVRLDVRRAHEVDRRRRGFRRAGRGILLRVEFGRKAAEIVDRARFCVDIRERRAARHPVRGDAQDRARLGQAFANRAPLTRPRVVLDRIHRTAVADEQRRHARCGAELVERFVHDGPQ